MQYKWTIEKYEERKYFCLPSFVFVTKDEKVENKK